MKYFLSFLAILFSVSAMADELAGQKYTGSSNAVKLATFTLSDTVYPKVSLVDSSGNPVSFSGGGAVTQSGTWTVQPGNTANTTAWKVTGTGGTFPVTGTFWQATQPVSIVSLPLPSQAANQPTLQGILDSVGQISDEATSPGVSGSISARIRSLQLLQQSTNTLISDLNDNSVFRDEEGEFGDAGSSYLHELVQVFGQPADSQSVDPGFQGTVISFLKGIVSIINGQNGPISTALYNSGNPADYGAGNTGTVTTLRVTLPYDQSVIPVQSPGSAFTNITTNTTTLIHSGFTVLEGFSINTKGVTSSVVIYNNTAGSGTKVGTFDTTGGTQYFPLKAQCTTGITAVTTGGTPADITFYWH